MEDKLPYLHDSEPYPDWICICLLGFPGGSEVKASACNAGDLGSIPRWGRSPGEGNGNPLQYSCLENPMDGGAWWATVHGVTKSRTRLSDFTFLSTFTFNILCWWGGKKEDAEAEGTLCSPNPLSFCPQQRCSLITFPSLLFGQLGSRDFRSGQWKTGRSDACHL